MRPARFEAALAEARRLFAIAGPLLAAQLAQMGMGLTDTLMVGRVGPAHLAAVALGTGLWTPLLLLALGTLAALSPMVAQLYGSSRHGEMGPVVRQGLWLSLFLALPAVLVVTRLEWLMVAMEVDPAVVPLAQGYLGALAWGVAPMYAYGVLRAACEGIGATRPVMLVGLAALAFNVAGNYVLIFGKLGAPALGAAGCGYATALAYWSMLLGLGAFVAWHRRFAPLAAFTALDGPRWHAIREVFGLGFPIGISIFAESSVFGAVALILGVYGATVMAGHQIALVVAGTAFMVPLSIGLATTSRVGQQIGRGDPEGARLGGWVGISSAAAVMACSALAIAALPAAIARLFTADPAVIEVAAMLLVLAAVFQVSDGIQVSASCALRGLKDTRVPMVITLIVFWVVGLPGGYLLATWGGMGPRGPWLGLILGLSCAAVALAGRFWRVTRSMADPCGPAGGRRD